MADYLSIIWTSQQAHEEWIERVGTEFSGSIKRDLNAERIVNAVFARTKKDKDKLEMLFYYPLRDADSVSFRLEIMEDIRNIPELYDILTDFSKAIPEIRDTHEKAYLGRNAEQDAARLLECANLYIKAVNNFIESTANLPIKSRGLLRLREHFVKIYESEEYKKLSERAVSIQQQLSDASSFFFVLNSGPNSIGIIKGDVNPDETIAGKLVKSAEIMFRNEQKFTTSIYNSVPTTPLEEELIMDIKKQAPEVFERLGKFKNKYDDYDFTEDAIEEYEFEFYLAYIAFMRTLEQRGFKFCIPRISETEERATGVYDLGLAQEVFDQGGDASRVIANDVLFNHDERIHIITGPNQGGKTTFARSIGLFQVLAQTGCPVAATSASVCIADKMLSQFPEREMVGANKGRLAEEVNRIAEMLRTVTDKSFIIFNESFASARRADGAELGRQLLKILLKKGCTVIFVTHLYELSQELDGDPNYAGVVSFMAEAQETEDGSGRRTYKIIRKTSTGVAFAMDICRRTGVTYNQIVRLLQERKILTKEENANV